MIQPIFYSCIVFIHLFLSFLSMHSALVPYPFYQPEVLEVPLQIKSKSTIRLASCLQQWPVAISNVDENILL